MKPPHSPSTRAGIVLIVAMSAANASNYAFHLLMTRLLGPEDYGALGALLGLMLVVGVPVNAVQAVVARRVAAEGSPQQRKPVIRTSLRAATLTAAAFATALLVLSPLIGGFLNLTSITPVALVAVAMLPTIITPVGRGALQGERRFALLGGGIAVSTFIRLGAGVLFGLWFGLSGAILGIVVGEAAGAVLALWPNRGLIKGAKHEPRVARELVKESAAASLALAGFWLLVSIDVMLTRHYLPAAEAGRYAAATLVGRAILFLPSAIAVLVYPSFVAHRSSEEGVRLLRRALLAVATIGTAGSVVVSAAPGLMLVLFGSGYESAGSVAPLLGLAMTAFGMTHIVLYHRLALQRSASILWPLVILQIAAIAVWHRSPQEVAVVMLIAGFVSLTSLLLGASPRARRTPVPQGKLWGSPSDRIDLTVVSPTYNGEAVIAPATQALTAALREAEIRFEVILVSDGCTDRTLEIARGLEDEDVRVLHYSQNQGKGYALRTGLAHATGKWVAFIDSDGDLDPVSLVHFFTLMKMYEADMVVGSKRHPLSKIRYPALRRAMSWSYHQLVRLLFGIKGADTQTGIKLIRRQLLADVLPNLEEKRFAFDLELMVAARRAGYRRILEAPIVLRYQFASTVSLRSVRGIIRDTLSIWIRCYILRRYEPMQRRNGHQTPPVDPAVLRPVGALR